MFKIELLHFHPSEHDLHDVYSVEIDAPAVLQPIDVVGANTEPFTGNDSFAVVARVPVSCTTTRKLVITMMPAGVECKTNVGAYAGCIRRLGATSDNLWRSYVFVKWADIDTWDQPLSAELGAG